jgi:hypothetical protein
MPSAIADWWAEKLDLLVVQGYSGLASYLCSTWAPRSGDLCEVSMSIHD